MTFVFENRPRVEDDILEALDYYFLINPKLAEDFLNRLEEAKQTILNSPEGFETKYKSAKTILLKQFPYHIYYLIEENKIVILAVLHAESGEEKIGKI